MGRVLNLTMTDIHNGKIKQIAKIFARKRNNCKHVVSWGRGGGKTFLLFLFSGETKVCVTAQYATQALLSVQVNCCQLQELTYFDSRKFIAFCSATDTLLLHYKTAICQYLQYHRIMDFPL